jgi:voltage-gated potassium channel
MSPSSFEDLDPKRRRRLVLRSAMRIAGSTVVLMLVYALTPVAGRSGARALLELTVGLLVFAGLLAWHLRRIVRSDHPELRAAEALAVAVPILIIVFAFTYLSLSRANPANFSQPLDRIGAMYFTVTVVSTVGFGDIVAKTDAARVLVTIQILLDLVLVVGIARTVVLAARIGVRRQQSAKADGPGDAST